MSKKGPYSKQRGRSDRLSVIKGPYPCEPVKGIRCIFWNYCAEDKLSCHQFNLYVQQGGNQWRRANRNPSEKHYRALFKEFDYAWASKDNPTIVELEVA